MVFSSLEFIYLFLPPVLLGFLVLQQLRLETAVIWWLILASFGFYAWWSPVYLLLLVGSIGFNYLLHLRLVKTPSKLSLAGGIAANLGVLFLFKYADFAIESFNWFGDHNIEALGIILPLAISFYTFQQISFLCDTYKGRLIECDFKRYILFVSFFPQLIAGPIVLQKDTIPQFKISVMGSKVLLNLSIGATLFAIGLFKKIVLADGVAPVANTVFQLADSGAVVSTELAWLGAIAYTFQIYFDFSGYCDMALGLARIFGIRLPINFNSPYKSLSIVEFWRRWHITLSRFLRDYLYIPLGGNRSGLLGAKGNLMITMLLGGLWHGAGWNFVIWGGLHGAFLWVNHGWSASRLKSILADRVPKPVYLAAAWMLTMFCVVVAWVFFRAETFTGATSLVISMTGLFPQFSAVDWQTALPDAANFAFIFAVLFGFVGLLPNSIQITSNYRPVIMSAAEIMKPRNIIGWSIWKPNAQWGVAIAILFAVSIIQIYRLNGLTEFIYFNF